MILGPQNLSFNHWRYRILHWSVGINPSTKEDSTLPNFFYTHYCPLFHATNAIALFFIPILIFKITSVIFQYLFSSIINLLEKSELWQQHRKDEKYKKEYKKKSRIHKFPRINPN